MQRRINCTLLATTVFFVSGGCADVSPPATDDDPYLADSVYESLDSDPEYQAFLEGARVRLDGETFYRVETDILLESEGEARTYYASLIGSRKGIVNLSGGVRDVRPDSRASTKATDVTYCFDDSNWGGTETGDTDGDGTANESLPTKSAVRDSLRAAARGWEGVANVRFHYESGNDGAGCSTSTSDLVVTLNESSSCTATGSFPSDSSQQITIPICGISVLLGIHELGHVLGFRHEHIHSNDPNRCSEGGTEGTDYEELFSEVDTQSAMIYAACGVGPDGIPGTDDDSVIARNDVSRRDGMAARILYGSPDWWWAVAI